jgi:hypothetical protein
LSDPRLLGHAAAVTRGSCARLNGGTLPTLALLIFVAARSCCDGATYPPLDPQHPIIGTLESDLAHVEATNQAGARAVVVGALWGRCEPQDGIFDPGSLGGLKQKIDAFRAGGKFVVLDLGVQYPPAWIFKNASSHFVDQYGHAYAPTPDGDCGVNLVFSADMRAKLAAYIHALFAALGSDFYAVRLGGGRYGELGYPGPSFGGDKNCYWGFDDLAQGIAPGLAEGVQPCPVAGWKPGMATPGHVSAQRFLDWYMDSMKNYHDWQIRELRRYFAGPLLMLYPSIGGLRPGQLEGAVQDDCAGGTGPEKTGEVSRGFDMARFVAGISDPNVVVYTTWVDGFPGCDDRSANPARWNPAHFLASLAAAHQPPLPCGGENTGHPDSYSNMAVTFQRLRDSHLCVLFWAFEPGLFDPSGRQANCANLAGFIAHEGL